MKGKIATIGFFDGVHKGHRFLFRQLDELGKARGLQPLIVTFEQHPRLALQSDFVPRLLSTSPERKALLSAFGEVLMLPFDAIQPLTAEQFMRRLHDEYQVSVLLMGYDHRFGSDRLKHPQDYRRIGAQTGIEVVTSGEFMDGEWHVSSTEIRGALENGNILLANELLGRPYKLSGTVVHGKGLGRTIGFPTANIEPDPSKIIPKAGVYAVRVHACSIDRSPAILNISTDGTIEVHIPSFRGDLYGQRLDVQFSRFIREEKQFDDLDELKEKIKEDVASL